jgi:hypothetical protein
MDINIKTRIVYFFKNTCRNCYNDIEFPLLGNFADNEFVLQTVDGKDFYIGLLFDNKAFDFIDNFLRGNAIDETAKGIYTRKILRSLADQVDNKKFSKDYPICPICRHKQNYYSDDNRSYLKELNYATWNDFESLTYEEKVKRIQQIITI